MREREGERKSERLVQCCSAPVSILFGHFGLYASAGHRSAKESGGEWHTRRPATEMVDPGSELGQRR